MYREANSSDYVFKHVLLRDTVYQSLVSSRRAELHLAIADALALRNANRLQEAAETLALPLCADRSGGSGVSIIAQWPEKKALASTLWTWPIDTS